MTVAIPDQDLTSQSGSSGSFTDDPLGTSSGSTEWDDLPPAAEVPPLEGTTLPPDTKPDDLPRCGVCGEVIIRDPSWKRMRKYHPECAKDAGKTRGDQAGGSRPRGADKASKEADLVIEDYRKILIRVAMMLSIVDPFDAFVIMVNVEPQCSTLHAFLITHEKFRKELLNVKGGGSVFSLIGSFVVMLAPIFAHHGLIPSKRIAQTLIDLPFALAEFGRKVKEGEQGMSDLMEKFMREAQERKQREKAAQNGTAQNRRGDPYIPGVSNVGASR